MILSIYSGNSAVVPNRFLSVKKLEACVRLPSDLTTFTMTDYSNFKLFNLYNHFN